MVEFVLCSTGLSKSERRTLELAASSLEAVAYSGDLTSETTHLIAVNRSASSAKLACAITRGLPVVLPSWISDSASAGSLLPLSAAYMVPQCVGGGSSPPPPVFPGPAATLRDEPVRRCPLAERQEHNSIESDPARTATEGVGKYCRKQQSTRGADVGAASGAGRQSQILDLLCELEDSVIHDAVSAGEDAPITIGGQTLWLDALTDFCRGAGTPGTAGGRGQGDPYSLRSLLLCLACRSFTHSEYCLACLRWEPYTPPVLVLDKAVLFRTLGLGQGASPTRADCDGSRSRGIGCAPQLLEPPASVDKMVKGNVVKAHLQLGEQAAALSTVGPMSDCELQLRSQVETLQRLLQSHTHTYFPVDTACTE